MYSEAEKALRNRLRLIERMKTKWPPRFAKLRKKGGSVMRFAVQYGYNDAHLCHQMKGRRGATQEYVSRVEADLKKERV